VSGASAACGTLIYITVIILWYYLASFPQAFPARRGTYRCFPALFGIRRSSRIFVFPFAGQSFYLLLLSEFRRCFLRWRTPRAEYHSSRCDGSDVFQSLQSSGLPAATAINQSGDFAFIGNGSNALFFRASGASSTTLLLQMGDQVPGFAGVSFYRFLPVWASTQQDLLLFGVNFNLPDGLPHAAILTYDGSSYIRWFLPVILRRGPNGASYGTNLLPGSVNDSGDVNFAAQPVTEPLSLTILSPREARPCVLSVWLTPLRSHALFASRWAGYLQHSSWRCSACSEYAGADADRFVWRTVRRKQEWSATRADTNLRPL